MPDRTPAETLRRAATMLCCTHSHPQPSLGTFDPCEHCGASIGLTTIYLPLLVGKPLRGPLAKWLNDHAFDHGVDLCHYDDDDGLCPALAVAAVILGEAT